MALLDKLRRVLHNRYAPFFLPVIATLVYIGLVILVIPENLGQSPSGDNSETTETPTAASATPGALTQDATSRAAKRRARLANRAANKAGVMDTPLGATPPVPVAPPAPMPASPDGAE